MSKDSRLTDRTADGDGNNNSNSTALLHSAFAIQSNKSLSRNVPLRGTKYIGELIKTMDDKAKPIESDLKKPMSNHWVLGKKVQRPFGSSFEKLNL